MIEVLGSQAKETQPAYKKNGDYAELFRVYFETYEQQNHALSRAALCQKYAYL